MQDVHEPIRATPQRGQRAEGQRAAAILAAEGRSSAIDQVFQTVHRDDPDPKVGAHSTTGLLTRLATPRSARSPTDRPPPEIGGTSLTHLMSDAREAQEDQLIAGAVMTIDAGSRAPSVEPLAEGSRPRRVGATGLR